MSISWMLIKVYVQLISTVYRDSQVSTSKYSVRIHAPEPLQRVVEL